MEGQDDLGEADREVADFLARSVKAHAKRRSKMRVKRERAKQQRRREQMTEERMDAPWRHFLREWRLERGFTIEDLSIATGVSKEMISRYETMKRGLSLDMQYRLIAALRIQPSQFFHHPKSDVAELIEIARQRANEAVKLSPEAREKMLAAIREIQSKL